MREGGVSEGVKEGGGREGRRGGRKAEGNITERKQREEEGNPFTIPHQRMLHDTSSAPLRPVP